jgi:hypothetical protein
MAVAVLMSQGLVMCVFGSTRGTEYQRRNSSGTYKQTKCHYSAGDVVVGGLGGWREWLGKQRSHGMAAVTFAHLLPGEGKIQWSGSKVLLLGLETMA